MNYKIVFNTLGKTVLVVGALFMIPLLVGLYYGEETFSSFLIPMAILVAVSIPLLCIKPTDESIYAKEGFVIVALSWIILSVAGAVPFVVSGTIPNFTDALFESVSGFSTTGASVLTASQIDDMFLNYKSIMFWRLFTHFIGGMGVLVFMLAVMPKSGEGAIYLFKAETTGPSASKLVSKLSHTARILYGIYVIMTAIEVVLLLFSGMGVYESLLNAFSTAGTGGLSLHGEGIAYYDSVYVEMVIAVFMFLFGINFNVYYLILVGSVGRAFKSEELRAYILMIVVATFAIAINLLSLSMNFGQALRYAFFQTASISSTTGFTTADFASWPALSKGIILCLTMIGASGGSTGGGMKVSRFMVLIKSCNKDLKRMVHPKAIVTLKLDNTPIEKETERNVRSYFILWTVIVIIATLLLSLDGYASGDVFTHFSATLAAIGNVGPGLNMVGPTLSYGGYSIWSKLVLSFVMLAGRLEIFPIIILFSFRTWKKNQ